MAQCLGLSAFTAMAWVQSLVGELRSCGLRRTPKDKIKKGCHFSANSIQDLVLSADVIKR